MYDHLRHVVVIKSPFHTFPVSFRLSQLSWPSSLAGRPMPTCPGSIPTWNRKTVDWNVDSRLSLEVRVHHVDIGHSVLKEFCRHLVCMGMGVREWVYGNMRYGNQTHTMSWKGQRIIKTVHHSFPIARFLWEKGAHEYARFISTLGLTS